MKMAKQTLFIYLFFLETIFRVVGIEREFSGE